ncbi:MAG: tetratricopeptide repeat protein [Crocosphaera sp.]|nr:tetratricopeptide repeat protein [Crocosphaera sp.]
MIPAVMKLSGNILPKAYKANELLNKKVRVWMENNYSPRSLLGIRDLWLIESHKRYLIWGNKERQKQQFLQQSKRRLYRDLGILGAILLLLMTGWGWLHYTTPGKLWQIRRELAYWGEKVRNDSYESKAAIAFAKDGQIKQMKALLDEIDDSYKKAEVLKAIASTYIKLSDSTEAVTLLKQALTVAQQIDDSYKKAEVLKAIAQASSELSKSTEAANLLKQALTVAQQIDDSYKKAEVLKAIASAYIKLSNSTEAFTLLKQALTVRRKRRSECRI